MAAVELAKPDLALFSDPAQFVVIPHLVAAPRTRRGAQVLVEFEGYEDATGFRGETRGRAYDLTCRFGGTEHAEMRDLMDLIEAARHTAADGRLALRTNFYTVEGLDLFEVVLATADPVERPAGGMVWEVIFPVSTVVGSAEV